MDREKFLEKLFPLIGGKENTSLCEFQDGVLYVTLKDAGLSDENAVAKLPDVASATLRRGALRSHSGSRKEKRRFPLWRTKIRTTARWPLRLLKQSVARRTLPAACTVSLGFVSTSKTLKIQEY